MSRPTITGSRLDVSEDPRLHDYVEETSRNWRNRPHPDPSTMQTLRRGTVRSACVGGMVLLVLVLCALLVAHG